MAKPTTAVAVKENAGVPEALAGMFDADTGSGFEDMTKDSYAVPFLKVLQSGSPQCKKLEATYVKGAEEGDFFNTVNERIYKNENGGVTFIPCYSVQKFNLWEPGEGTGKFRGSLSSAEGHALLRNCTQNEDRETITPDGLIIADCREHYGLVVNDDGTSDPVLLALVSTQIKKSKKWCTYMNGLRLPSGLQAPMCSHQYNLSTVGESNDYGAWAGVTWKDIGYVTSADLYKQAQDFREMIRSGEAKVVVDQDDLPY